LSANTSLTKNNVFLKEQEPLNARMEKYLLNRSYSENKKSRMAKAAHTAFEKIKN